MTDMEKYHVYLDGIAAGLAEGRKNTVKILQKIHRELENARKFPFASYDEDEGLRIALEIVNKYIGEFKE